MITSRHNPHVKEIRDLAKRKDREEKGLFLVEGSREISHVDPKFIERVYRSTPLKGVDYEVILMAPELIEELTYRGGDAIALVRMEKQKLGEASLIVAAEGIEKPGNLGALMRTADAAGFDAVVSLGGGVDLYSPNVIRASLGAFFTQTVCEMSQIQLIEHCTTHKIALFAASPEAATSLYEIKFPPKVCLIIGSEAFGVSASLKEKAQLISLPMYGKIDSLNASTAFGIIAYEIVRQRNLV